MLERGILDAAIVGEDMLIEHDSNALHVVARAGFFNCLLALVTRSGDVTPPSTVVSQYPRYAAREFSRRGVSVTAIAGAAEGWVAGGLFDATVDTWRTGATATANGLDIARPLRVTTLALVRRTDAAVSPALRLGWDVLRGFRHPGGRR
jgi:ATP phosphoribosyltransferase